MIVFTGTIVTAFAIRIDGHIEPGNHSARAIELRVCSMDTKSDDVRANSGSPSRVTVGSSDAVQSAGLIEPVEVPPLITQTVRALVVRSSPRATREGSYSSPEPFRMCSGVKPAA